MPMKVPNNIIIKSLNIGKFEIIGVLFTIKVITK
jgi:hypothetical protein